MAGTAEKPGSSSESSDASSELTVVEAIRLLAHRNANAKLDNEYQLTLFLRSWWSRTYDRPLKDPLLQTYTVEELLYEFFDRRERELARELHVEEEADRIEDKDIQKNLDWAEEEERKELEALRNKGEEEPEEESPLEDPANKAWMEEQIKKEIEEGKKLFGDDFGEDITEDFDG